MATPGRNHVLDPFKWPLKLSQQTGFTDTVVVLREATIRAISQLSDKVKSQYRDMKTESDAQLVERSYLK